MDQQSPTSPKQVPAPAAPEAAPAAGPGGPRAADTPHAGDQQQRLNLAPLIKVVKSATHLQSVVQSGAQHVEIREHLDLRKLDRIPAESRFPVIGLDGPHLALLYAMGDLQSIRVRFLPVLLYPRHRAAAHLRVAVGRV